MIMRVVFIVFFGGLGVMFLVVGIKQLAQQRRLLASAIEVDAMIVESRVEKSVSANTDRRPLRSNSTTSYTPVVRFRYTVNGSEHESTMLRPTEIETGYASESSASAELTAFAEGAKVRAYVDPSLPEKGFVIKESGAGPVVFLVLSLVAPAAGFLFARLA